jgi:aspartyl-tRNA(Asn)/glutamyl-tRNA(Gln) amidotransferase subunit A
MLNELTILQAHEGLKKKEFSSLELTQACLDSIKKQEKNLNAFISLTEKVALESAKAIDKNGNFENALAGIPVAIKDNLNITNIKTTAASKILKNYIAPYDATVIKKLKEQGMILLGKTNMDEFACGSSTETSYFGPTKNPHDLKRVPGGSSGGSAVAVAANECIYALGSDTGGSIRQPASLCGVVGLKPTYGRVSRYGLLAMASSLDQIGPLVKNVEDAAIVLEVIAGRDQNDSTTVKQPVPSYIKEIKKSIKGLKIGVPKEYFVKGIDKDVEGVVRDAIKKLEDLGAKIIDVSLPHAEYGLAVYYIIMPSELSSNLARYDGVKYGFSDRSGKTLLDNYLDTRGKGLGAEIRRRIMLGTYTLSAGYYDAYYLQAQRVRTLVSQDFKNTFEKVDCLVTPTSPTVAFKIGEKIDDPLSMYLSDIYTVSANIAGVPAISIPCSTTKPKDGQKELPVGLQIIGPQFDERRILQVAWNLEQALA